MNICFTKSLSICIIFCLIRYYVQLPTEKAHNFHDECGLLFSKSSHIELIAGKEACIHVAKASDTNVTTVGLHPMVVQRLQDLVATGQTNVFMIRKLLRWCEFIYL